MFQISIYICHIFQLQKHTWKSEALIHLVVFIHFMTLLWADSYQQRWRFGCFVYWSNESWGTKVYAMFAMFQSKSIDVFRKREKEVCYEKWIKYMYANFKTYKTYLTENWIVCIVVYKIYCIKPLLLKATTKM